MNARRTAAVRRVDVPIAGLPAGLARLHHRPDQRRARRADDPAAVTSSAIVAAVNALDADLVAITGDLVDGSVPELAPHVAPLAGLRSRDGTFFVTGNHEYYSGAAAWVAELRRLGLTRAR